MLLLIVRKIKIKMPKNIVDFVICSFGIEFVLIILANNTLPM
jgi:hypothetical protein